MVPIMEKKYARQANAMHHEERLKG